jgi:hypothetical protein
MHVLRYCTRHTRAVATHSLEGVALAVKEGAIVAATR